MYTCVPKDLYKNIQLALFVKEKKKQKTHGFIYKKINNVWNFNNIKVRIKYSFNMNESQVNIIGGKREE